MSEDENDLPVAVWEGTFRVFGIDVRCAVLEDGRRLINPDDFFALLFDGAREPREPGDLDALLAWQKGATPEVRS